MTTRTHNQRHRSQAAIGILALGVVLSTIPASAVADPGPTAKEAPAVSTATAAFPTFVHLPADQAAHPNAAHEWWYIIGHVNARGHRFGYQVTIGGGAVPLSYIAITDKTTGEYFQQSLTFSPYQASFSATELDARVPSATLSGPMDAMRVHATLPVGTIDLTLRARGPAMFHNGTGLIPFLGGTTYYYSLPSVATQGTLTVNGTAYQVVGESWLDRQWGTWNWSTMRKWTWMAVRLSNGDSINLWDLLAEGKEFPYATILRPNGIHEVVAVNPLADTTSAFWTSPTTGKRYGTRWTVRIPSLDTTLDIVVEPQGQEVQSFGGLFEGAGTVTGRYRGKPITGLVYVEQNGDWR